MLISSTRHKCDKRELKALAIEDTLLPTQMFPRLPSCATFVAGTNFVSVTQKMFLILFINILCPQQMFPSLRNMETQHSFCVPRVSRPRNIISNNVSATMCPRLPGPLSKDEEVNGSEDTKKQCSQLVE